MAANLSQRIAERLDSWCPNSPKPRYSIEGWKEIFNAEDALAARQAAAEAKSLGLDTLRQRNAALEKRVAHLERLFNATFKKLTEGVKISNENWTKQMEAEEQLVARIETLEQRQLKFLGVYEPGRSYQPNSLVVRSGSLWCSLSPTTDAPGRSSSWQLVTKQGEIGKELVAR